MSLEIVILAAGKGKRMLSDLPKVLHPIAGKTMIEHVLTTAKKLSPIAVHVVVGHKAEMVEKLIYSLPRDINDNVSCVIQKEQLGTGHAVSCVLPNIANDSDVLVLYGDTPLTPEDVLRNFIKSSSSNPLSVLSAYADNPYGYGRIVRDSIGNLEYIVEEKDASDQNRAIHEVNTGIIFAKASILKKWLPKIRNNNSQGEYYLTDLAGMLVEDGQHIGLYMAPDFNVLGGVNNKSQLAFAERIYQKMQAERLMRDYGVTLADPSRLDIRGCLVCGQDCYIDINCVFEGNVQLGDRVRIETGCVIKNCSIGADSIISPYTVMEDSVAKKRNTIGPFARLRPGNILEDEVHIGDFVEVKKSSIGKGTKAGHLSYLGDAVIGENVNVGAGSITCNYDGANKHTTEIGDNVFIGSDTQMVAPVNIPDGVTIGAGTTYTSRINVERNALVITRSKELVLSNYKRPQKKHS